MSDSKQNSKTDMVRIVGLAPIAGSDAPCVCTREGAQQMVIAKMAEWVDDDQTAIRFIVEP